MEFNREREFKGIWIPKHIFECPDLPWTAKIIFLEIDSFTSKGNDCYFSNEYLAEFVNISPTQVSRNIALLIEKGWIRQTHFDGRKRYLETCLTSEFAQGSFAEKRKAEETKTASEPCGKAQGSIDEKRKHNNTVNNTTNNTMNKEEEVKAKKAFQPPTLEEVIEYFFQRTGNGKEQAEYYYDYRTKTAWKLKSGTIKDYKADIRNWIARDKSWQKPPEKNTSNTFTELKTRLQQATVNNIQALHNGKFTDNEIF